MAFKVVVSNKADTYQLEVDEAKALNGLVIGDEFDGGIVGLDGYTLQITGGSDKNGFTMKKDVPGTRRIKSLLTGGIGYHPKADGVKRRKTVRGNTIADDIVQINSVVVKEGAKPIAEILGAGEEEEEE
ncbi:30S ribosomal protein S6e [Methanobrevibacter millerae]|jgi:small subunit ribosomal protein S6e|uniref:Small ribosomal subunit protein eS6 n=1 Tax=Methanobrevibacter millerae TaxID=230361 RepID=A0A0U3EJ91_9EURY|nr:30S ribosomal protein S6e [Methanobrevibacter millerae]ALT68637.1 ribosomal protein S6e Rps6e [Methanobrevibacter millerae]